MIHNRVVGRFEQGVRDVIARIALQPPIKDGEGRFSKSYHANVIDPDDLEKFRILANDAFEVMSQHFFWEDFSFRFEWGFAERDGEQVKALIPRGDYGKAIALLGLLIFKNETIKPKKPEPADVEWRAEALKTLQAAAARRQSRVRRGLIEPDPVELIKMKPDAPLDTKLDEYGPPLWQILQDTLLMMQLPERAFVHQAKSRDGWWNKKGRQLAVYKNVMRTLAHNFWDK